VQKRRTGPAQFHQRRRAEFRAPGRHLEIRESVVGEIARQIEGIEDSALAGVVIGIVFLHRQARDDHYIPWH